jgi:hypothetical protein
VLSVEKNLNLVKKNKIKKSGLNRNGCFTITKNQEVKIQVSETPSAHSNFCLY